MEHLLSAELGFELRSVKLQNWNTHCLCNYKTLWSFHKRVGPGIPASQHPDLTGSVNILKIFSIEQLKVQNKTPPTFYKLNISYVILHVHVYLLCCQAPCYVFYIYNR